MKNKLIAANGIKNVVELNAKIITKNVTGKVKLFKQNIIGIAELQKLVNMDKEKDAVFIKEFV